MRTFLKFILTNVSDKIRLLQQETQLRLRKHQEQGEETVQTRTLNIASFIIYYCDTLVLAKYYSIFTQILIAEQRRSLSRMRAAMMTAASLALTMTVLGNAWSQRQQFYPSVVYITKSNPSMAVIYLQVA